MPEKTDIQELLAHAEWLRGLARHLVRDEAAAADAVQQTWASALRSPPDAQRPARPWLAQVLRNSLRKDARAARNRGARELASSRDATAPSSEALLESMQLQRLLGELVVALDEPYRAAILLRYYEGLEPVRIAEALGVPAGTVRWRVSEGVARLRVALGKRMGGDRAWRLALLPLLSEPPATTGKGVLMAVSTKTKVALAVAALCVSLGGGTLVWQGERASAARGLAAAGGDGENAPARGDGENDPGLAAAAPPAQTPGLPGVGDSPAGQDVAGAALTRAKAPPRFVPAPAPAGDSAPRVADIRGRLAAEDIREGISSAIPEVKECYDKLLMENPAAAGLVSVQFTIVDKEGKGRISDATIVPRTQDGGAPELVSTVTESCILQALARATFAVPKGGPVIVRYPFAFTSTER